MPDDDQPLAFSPGSITCFFHVVRGESPQTTVSHGCAVNITEGVTAGVSESEEHRVLLNDHPISLPTVYHVLTRLAPRPVTIHLRTHLAVGCGFGVSASSALSAAFAIDRYFQLKRLRQELGMLAHVAEVDCGTGVGDVAAQLCGGVVYRRCKTGPFDCQRLAVADCPLMYVVFGSLSTRETLKTKDTVRAITQQGQLACRWLESQRSPSLPAILRRSREFAGQAKLITPQVQDAIDAATACGQEATMILLGQSVVAAGQQLPGPDWTATSVDEQGTRTLA